MNKKFLAKLLIFCMVFTMLPMAAFAADETTAGGSANVYTVTFDANGGILAGDMTYSAEADTTIKLINATKDGSTLIGWTTTKGDATTNVGAAGANYKVTGNVTLFALWKTNVDGVVLEPEGDNLVATLTVEVDENSVTNNPDIFGVYDLSDDATALTINLVAGVAKNVEVNLSANTLNSLVALKDTYAAVILKTNVGDVELSQDVLKAAIGESDNATVTLTIANSTEAANVPTTAKAVYDVELTVAIGDAEPTKVNFAGKTVRLTVLAGDVDTTKNFTVRYVENGSYAGATLNSGLAEDGRIYFDAPHFSTIAIDQTENGGFYGGGGGSTGNVSIATKVTGGKVTVTPTRPTRGQTVTINVTPNEGYKLDTLVVTDNKGNNVELTKVSDNKYTFVMPAGKVTVTPTFVKTNATDETKDPAAVKRFSDVASGAWYAEYITYVTENALMNGYDDGRFGPNDQTTRAQIVTVLYRLEGEPATRSSNSFSDVSAGGQYYSSAVAWAAINNIVNGYEDGRFGPNDNVTREQIAAILYRYATYKGYDTENAGSIANFSDAAKVSSWANTAISWAVGEELMNGDNGALRPQGNATRAEIAALLMRFCENIAK